MIELIRYTKNEKTQWDNLITNSKNGTFLFYRDYMEYHENRFQDCSFLIYRKGKVQGAIPGNISNKTFYSHQGLSYGGIILNSKLTTNDVLEIFNNLEKELLKFNIQKIVYKPIPYIYYQQPSQEDLYVLFLKNAKKISCNISSTIYLNNKIKFIESRKSGLRKAKKSNVQVNESSDLVTFWNILNENLLNKFTTKPVHNLNEIKHLKSLFPTNIKLFVAESNHEIIAGTIVFIFDHIIHVQYISSNNDGREKGALDLLFDQLINKIFNDKLYFDFGHSNEKMGKELNQRLIFQKEGFGARGVINEIYEYHI